MWAQIINAILGIWLMAAPAILGYNGLAADNDNVAGPVIATIAITAIFESTRNLRLANVPIGAWLIIGPWILGFDSTAAIIAETLTGILVIGLSFVKGTVKEKFDGGWTMLWK